MKETLLALTVSGVLFVASVPVLIYAAVKKKRHLVGICVGILVLAGIGGLVSGVLFAKASYREVQEVLKPRTGKEIYVALFGKPQPDCVEVVKHRDQTVPMIDSDILLEAKTCPQEVQRIFGQFGYDVVKSSTGPAVSDSSVWVNLSAFGDSVWVWTHFDDYGNGREVYISTDSTRMYCRDVLN